MCGAFIYVGILTIFKTCHETNSLNPANLGRFHAGVT